MAVTLNLLPYGQDVLHRQQEQPLHLGFSLKTGSESVYDSAARALPFASTAQAIASSRA
jgi:hypothetical protein